MADRDRGARDRGRPGVIAGCRIAEPYSRSGPVGTLQENDPSSAVCTEASIAALAGPPIVEIATRAPRIGRALQTRTPLTVTLWPYRTVGGFALPLQPVISSAAPAHSVTVGDVRRSGGLSAPFDRLPPLTAIDWRAGGRDRAQRVACRVARRDCDGQVDRVAAVFEGGGVQREFADGLWRVGVPGVI